MLAEHESEFDRLFNAYRSDLLGIAARHLPGRLRRIYDPEDIVQSAYFSASRAFPDCQFAGQQSFGAWLRKVVTNEAKQTVRNEHRKKRDKQRRKSRR